MKKLSIFSLVMVLCLVFTACDLPFAKNQSEQEAIPKSVISNNQYTSEFTGLTAQLPESWVVSSDAEIEMYMGLEAGTLTDEKDPTIYSKEASHKNGIYDLLATDPATGTSFSINIEDAQIISDKDTLTVEEYYDMLRTSLESKGTVHYDSMYSITLSGKPFEVITFSFTTDVGTSRFIYGTHVQDNYIITVRAVSLYDMQVQEVEQLFQ